MGKGPRTFKRGKLSDCQEVQSRLCVKATHGPSEADLLGCKAWMHWPAAVKLGKCIHISDSSFLTYKKEASTTTGPTLGSKGPTLA